MVEWMLLVQIPAITTSTMSNSTLSSEAHMFRWLISNYIAEGLWHGGHIAPMTVISDESLVVVYSQDLDLQGAFERAVDMFIEINDNILDELMIELPQTMAHIDDCITESGAGGFTYGNATRGRLVAVAAFVVKLVQQFESTESIAQLFDLLAAIADDTMLHVIRGNGGWLAFARAYPKKLNKEPGWITHADDTITS